MIRIDIAQKINNPSALTQEQGTKIYNAIVTSFEHKEDVTLDFANVESMISPFLNNAIGQLYGKYTGEYLSKHLHLANFPSVKNSTLNVVISNAKKFYADKDAFTETAKDVLNIE
ncbi:STAS-like domain-containing protein [Dorea sp. AM58-8]|uniref:STAS-like domain-containing protein n=1 Tax=Dorea sp. AM58-8 TaxID=2292346 RepID=UPI000E4B3CC9|nr:STAS-like domain-containing protein [Dorea sp. AM58-8]RGY83177.1 DUF4325 domain-containing protein [Dorea sp. AM58-8]